MTESGTTLMPRPRREPAAVAEPAPESLPERTHFTAILPARSAFKAPKGRLGTR